MASQADASTDSDHSFRRIGSDSQNATKLSEAGRDSPERDERGSSLESFTSTRTATMDVDVPFEGTTMDAAPIEANQAKGKSRAVEEFEREERDIPVSDPCSAFETS